MKSRLYVSDNYHVLLYSSYVTLFVFALSLATRAYARVANFSIPFAGLASRMR
jgi:hypothetical protein